MEENLGPEAIQALGNFQLTCRIVSHSTFTDSLIPLMFSFQEVLDQHKRACQDRYYRQALKRESEKARYVDTHSKVNSLKQMVAKELGFKVTVQHPRLWYLLDTEVGGPIQNLGTPPTPRWDAQGQLVEDIRDLISGVSETSLTTYLRFE
ncbi:uncharacterized protein PGTG_14653 [Puccinia graminis f. sp. tritici CRL 75-36-700-3]|uniref:Uncharacterized protein n=1 Tax=Puccinia graminis f. sp. tritici (strain CRL 75-36-700-3 / race SCCL) TaxID=418459 RepID=E3KWM0_PUCGT|nr:uncharacterized protein PGTG_14653 [Puccinia graminis f. sp. tritici CRL 75-36-700-3]EFP88687.1 hypothetical protein PGTG_14653 [Puccinia graminis f. sp. tritici CRL 75-36-700-3]